MLNGSPQCGLDCVNWVFAVFVGSGCCSGLKEDFIFYIFGFGPWTLRMQSLIRSKSAGVTGGRGTAGAGPGRDLLYGSRGVPAAPTYRRPGDLGPHEPCPSTPRVRIVDSVETTPDWEAREERRTMALRTESPCRTGLDMEDLVSMCERRCRKACNLRSAAEDSEEACHSGSSGGTGPALPEARVTQARGRNARAMDTDPSPVRLWELPRGTPRAIGQLMSPSESEEMARPPTRANTAPEPSPGA